MADEDYAYETRRQEDLDDGVWQESNFDWDTWAKEMVCRYPTVDIYGVPF